MLARHDQTELTVRYADDGKQRVETERIEVPPDLANGLILTLLKNVQPGAPPPATAVSAAFDDVLVEMTRRGGSKVTPRELALIESVNVASKQRSMSEVLCSSIPV